MVIARQGLNFIVIHTWAATTINCTSYHLVHTNFTFTYFIAFTYFPFLLAFAASSLLIACLFSSASTMHYNPFNWIILKSFHHKSFDVIETNSCHQGIIVVAYYCHYTLYYHDVHHPGLCLHGNLYFVFHVYFLCLYFYYYQNDLEQKFINRHRLHQCYLFSFLWDIADTSDLLFSYNLYFQLLDLIHLLHCHLIHLYQII